MAIGVPERSKLADIYGGPLANPYPSVYAHIERGLLKNPHKPAVICMHQRPNELADWVGLDDTQEDAEDSNGPPAEWLTLTYAQLHGGALRLVAGLLASGVRPEGTVLCLMENSAEFALLVWACNILRLTLAPLDLGVLAKDGAATEIGAYLQSLKPGLVIVPDANGAQIVDSAVADQKDPLPPFVRLTASSCPRDRSLSPSLGWTYLRDVVGMDASWHGTDSLSEDALLEDARRDDPERTHSIYFTSGTSVGRGKGCPVSVGATAHILESQHWLITEDNCARVLQQAHNARSIALRHTLQTWRVGGAIVMPTGPSFAIQHTIDAIVQHRVTFIVLSPAMVHALARALPAVDDGSSSRVQDSVRAIQVGGDSVTCEVLQQCAAQFPRARVFVNHGMSEGGGFFDWPFFGRPAADIPCCFGGAICPVGTVARGARVRVWDTRRGTTAARLQPGELHVSSPSLIRGYVDGVGASSFYKDEEGVGWMSIGDVGLMNEDGLVYILGRNGDAIVTQAGAMIMPALIESCIEKYTGAQVSVVAVPSPTLGTQPFAVVNNLNGRLSDQINTEVKWLLGEDYGLAGVVTLEQIGLDAFPVNATHKIVKFEVQKAVLRFLMLE
ncbi:putative NRPS-like protein biosynthetic cluster [Pestalotiopsis sp. 9143b]|nr:putative NRPS-like protein biosynthetic cluster [Pestalotiopsis sp. 9143b]